MPQPQNDGSLQGGNLEVFESLLNDPVVLSPPRAETFVRRHIKPADGMWTQEAMEVARTVFAMAAVGRAEIHHLQPDRRLIGERF